MPPSASCTANETSRHVPTNGLTLVLFILSTPNARYRFTHEYARRFATRGPHQERDQPDSKAYVTRTCTDGDGTAGEFTPRCARFCQRSLEPLPFEAPVS